MRSDDAGRHGHPRVEELLALEALGGLSDDEQAELDQWWNQVPRCPVCRRLQREYRETAAALAYALPPLPPPPDADHRLRAACRHHRHPDRPAPGE